MTTRGRGEESASSSTENYPRELPKVRGSTNKSRRLSSRTKLSRPFAGNFVEGRKGNLEKFVDEEVASDGIRHFGGRNIQGNDVRIGERHANGQENTLHEREDIRDSPTNVQDPLSADLRKSDAIGDRISESASHGDGARKSSQIPEESGSFKDGSSWANEPVHANGSDLDNFSKQMETPTTPSSFESHQDVTIPVVAEHSPRSNSYVYHPSSLLSTVDASATSTDSWTSEPRLNEPKQSGKEATDGLAEATGVENGENIEGDEKYENHEGRQVENHDQQSHEYIHENERAAEGAEDGAGGFEKDKDSRHAEKHDVRAEDDVASDGSHDTESHRSAKEGAGGGGKFEKGEATEREQQHRESDDEKGEKVRLSFKSDFYVDDSLVFHFLSRSWTMEIANVFRRGCKKEKKLIEWLQGHRWRWS